MWRFLRLGLVDFFSDKMKRFGVAKPSYGLKAARVSITPNLIIFSEKKSTATAQRLRRWPAAATNESRSRDKGVAGLSRICNLKHAIVVLQAPGGRARSVSRKLNGFCA